MPDQVREQLQKLIASDVFCRTRNPSLLLSYAVEKALAGSDSLKEYAIAIDALGNGEDFNPATDPSVRTAARDVRTGLLKYYKDEGRKDPVEIDLPRGTYIPTFKWRARTESPQPDRFPRREARELLIAQDSMDPNPVAGVRQFATKRRLFDLLARGRWWVVSLILALTAGTLWLYMHSSDPMHDPGQMAHGKGEPYPTKMKRRTFPTDAKSQRDCGMTPSSKPILNQGPLSFGDLSTCSDLPLISVGRVAKGSGGDSDYAVSRLEQRNGKIGEVGDRFIVRIWIDNGADEIDADSNNALDCQRIAQHR